MESVKTAVIGCGAISDIYLRNMTGKFSGLEVTACSAAHIENAQKKAAEYGIKAATTQEILADPGIEMVVILTPAPAHYDLIRQALLAGKHVYTEKPIATRLDQGLELLALAREKGLCLGCAPETFMGSAVQTARKALDDGICGQISSFHIVANRDLTVLASMFRFLRLPGGGIAYDYGVYYLTVLAYLLGPMEQVYARTGNLNKIRKNCIPIDPEYGQDYVYDNEAQVNAILTTRSGVTGTLSLNGDSAMQDQAYFTIQGTGGILQLGDANQFGGPVRFLPDDPRQCEWRTLEPVSELSDNCRGIGPADMARCIRSGQDHLASGEMGCHVLDIIEQIMNSAESGTACGMRTQFPRQGLLEGVDELLR